MNNYCRNCGNKLNNNPKNCDVCGAEAFEKRVLPDDKKIELELQKKKEKKYIITIILLFVSSYLIPTIVSCIFVTIKLEYNLVYQMITLMSPLLSLSALIMLIYARIKMKGSKAIRVLFSVFIILVSLYFLFILIIMVACMSRFSGW